MQVPTVSGASIAICIDDFGRHPGVNAAALELAAMGRVQAISCQTGAPEWARGAAALARLSARDVDLGLHLDFTEYPRAASNRRPLAQLLALGAAGLLDRRRLRAEIDAQLDAFEQALGRAPAHIDGHQHVHQFPGVREVLIEALRDRYPHHAPWLRRTKRSTAAPSGGLKPWLIERLGCNALSRLAQENGFPQNRHLLGVYDFRGGAGRYAVLLSQWLDAAGQGDLLMCHAGLGSPEAHDPILEARRDEYQVLSGAPLADILARTGVRLAPMSRIEASG